MLSRDTVMVAEALRELIEGECFEFKIDEEKDRLEGTVTKTLDIYIFGDLVTSVALDVKEE